jgi:phosphopantothenoylcysteine decarboxylase / phosphopantothenate---cysteine ligase
MSGSAASSGRSSLSGGNEALRARHPGGGPRVVLGVTGGIAAYKTVQLARDLTLLGATVDVVLTRSAREFVGAVSYEGVTGRRVWTELVARGAALDHIALARSADVICIAPATADFLARAAAGRSSDLLTAILLATRAPVLVCPAMNDRMWSHPATLENAERLRARGCELVGPAVGALAFGEGEGAGRMEEPHVILQYIGRALETDTHWRGLRVLVTAGPTREAVDPVRVLSNRSSGRMGYALAAAAWRRGAEVDLVSGPVALQAPVGVRVHRVETVAAMRDAVLAALPGSQALFMAAAPADFQPATPADRKIKKSDAPDAIALCAAPDILRSTREARPPGLLVVGFALETGDGRRHAREKLTSKGMDIVVLNDATEPGAGFETTTNRVVLLDADGAEHDLPLMSKDDVADAILDHAAHRLRDA